MSRLLDDHIGGHFGTYYSVLLVSIACSSQGSFEPSFKDSTIGRKFKSRHTPINRILCQAELQNAVLER